MDKARWNFIIIFGRLIVLLQRIGGRRLISEVTGATAALVPIQRLRRFGLKTFLWTALIVEREPDA